MDKDKLKPIIEGILKDILIKDGYTPVHNLDYFDGENGKDGFDGKDGKDGQEGSKGDKGQDGINGLDGKDGIDGKDGLNGKDGKDGKDGENGLDGSPDSPLTIANKLNSLTEVVDDSVIKGFPDLKKRIELSLFNPTMGPSFADLENIKKTIKNLPSGGVSSLNGETGSITLVAGSNITITPSGQNITIASTGGAGVESVTDDGGGVISVDNTDPLNPIVDFDGVFVDGVTVTGNGTSGNPLIAAGGSSPWTENSGTLYPTTITDNVYVGRTVTSGTPQLFQATSLQVGGDFVGYLYAGIAPLVLVQDLLGGGIDGCIMIANDNGDGLNTGFLIKPDLFNQYGVHISELVAVQANTGAVCPICFNAEGSQPVLFGTMVEDGSGSQVQVGGNGQISTSSSMPTADPMNGAGVLWYDPITKIVYRGT